MPDLIFFFFFIFWRFIYKSDSNSHVLNFTALLTATSCPVPCANFYGEPASEPSILQNVPPLAPATLLAFPRDKKYLLHTSGIARCLPPMDSADNRCLQVFNPKFDSD